MLQYFEGEDRSIKVNEIATHLQHPFSSLSLLFTLNVLHHSLAGYQHLHTEKGQEEERSG